MDDQPSAVGGRPVGQRLSRRARLSRKADFLRCYRRGRKKHGPLFVLHLHPNAEELARLGITASRKVGNAVQRHRAKRRVRELFRRFEKRRNLAGLDMVFHLKPAAGSADSSMVAREVHRVLTVVARDWLARRGGDRQR